MIAAGNDHLFGLMAQAMGRPDLLENPNYKTNALRHSNVQMLEDDLEKTLRERKTQDWLDALNAAGVPCGPVNTRLSGVQRPASHGSQHAGLDR